MRGPGQPLPDGPRDGGQQSQGKSMAEERGNPGRPCPREPLPGSPGSKDDGEYSGHGVAEREGFEPSKRYERLHAFQACALSRSAISPARARNSSLGGRQERMHLVEQVLRRERLCQVEVRAAVQSTLDLAFPALGREHDDLHAAP
jgi:hypothetical protein